MSQHPHPCRRSRGTPVAAALLGTALTFGCTASIEQGAPQSGRDDQGRAGAPGGTGMSASPRDSGAKPSDATALPGAGACPTAPVPPARVVRLTPVQIVNTLRGSFGATSVSAGMLPFDGVTEGFDTNGRSNYVSDRFAAALRELAKGVGVAQAPALLQATPCLQAAPVTSECAGAFVAGLGERAFRRPLDADERERFGALLKAQAGARGGAAAVAATLEAMLQSPRFVYRTELGAGGEGARVPLTPFEIASSLSFLVTDAPPDAELMQAARDGKLGDRSVVAAQAKRLLKTPLAREKLKTFFSQLLGVRELAAAAIPKDTTLVPTWTESLRQDLVSETLTLVDRAFASEGKPLVELFTAPYSYLNPRLIKHYGLPPGADTSNTLKKVDVPPGMAGLLSRGAVMAKLAHESTTSPVHRGVFVRETLLCSPPPLPPPGASNQTDLLNGTTADATQRERYAAFQKNAPKECAGCHELFQPLGLAFERFDAAGRPRDVEFGKPIDTSGTLVGGGDADGPFADGVELAGKIARSRAGQACFVGQYARFALGFGRGEVDDCHVQAAAAAFREGALTAEALLVATTQSDAFYFRSRLGGQAP